MDWYYVKAGQRVGPVDVAGLKDLIAKGELGQGDLVWNQTMGRDWSKVSAVTELQVGSEASAPKEEAPVEPTPTKVEVKPEPKPEPKPEEKPAAKAKSEPVREKPAEEAGPKKSLFGGGAAKAAKADAAKPEAKETAAPKSSSLLKKREPTGSAEPVHEPAEAKEERDTAQDPELLPGSKLAGEPQNQSGGAKLHVKRNDALVRPVEPEPVVAAAPEAKPKGLSIISAALAQQKQTAAAEPDAGEGGGISSIRSSLAALNKTVSAPAEEAPAPMLGVMPPVRDMPQPAREIVIPDQPMVLSADEIVRQGRAARQSDKEIMDVLVAQGVSKSDAKQALKTATAPARRLPGADASASGGSKSYVITVGALAAVLLVSLGVLGFLIWQRFG